MEIDRYLVAERITPVKKVRSIFHVTLFILVTGMPIVDRHIHVSNSVCAKEPKNENQQDRPLVEVTLRLEGKTLPGKPKVVSADDTFAALYEKAGTLLNLQEVAGNTWKCRMVKGDEYVIGWIVTKGWFEKHCKMFGYRSASFTANDDLTVTFSPGMPATFEYDLTNPPDNVQVFPARVILVIETLNNGKTKFLNLRDDQSRPGVVRIEGLAGGKYSILAQFRYPEKYSGTRTPLLYDRREVEIKPGIVNHFEPSYPEIDSTVEEGDVTIHGTLYGPDKKPLASKIVQVIPLVKNGFDLSLYYPSSITDSNGRFEFVGIRPNREVYVSSENTSILLSKLSLTENASVSTDIVLGLKKLPVVVGDLLSEIIIDWKEGNTGKLSDLAGNTVVLDVWAAWCGSCIRAFPELNSLATELSSDSNIVFIALSIDYDEAIWKKMVNESNWKALKHGRLNRLKNSFSFNRPIPYSMIIDKDGIVRAEGSGLNIRLELEKLAKNSDPLTVDTPEHSIEN